MLFELLMVNFMNVLCDNGCFDDVNMKIAAGPMGQIFRYIRRTVQEGIPPQYTVPRKRFHGYSDRKSGASLVSHSAEVV
jgi:hypothetical protein